MILSRTGNVYTTNVYISSLNQVLLCFMFSQTDDLLRRHSSGSHSTAYILFALLLIDCLIRIKTVLIHLLARDETS